APPPLVLFVATAAALTFWRGFGPGMVASALGSVVGSELFIKPAVAHIATVPIETVIVFASSMAACWLIYRLKVSQEDSQTIQDRRNNALAFVSHELRQPLANIHLAARLLDRDPSELTRRRATALIERSAMRLGRVVDDLADVARLQAGAVRVE